MIQPGKEKIKKGVKKEQHINVKDWTFMWKFWLNLVYVFTCTVLSLTYDLPCYCRLELSKRLLGLGGYRDWVVILLILLPVHVIHSLPLDIHTIILDQFDFAYKIILINKDLYWIFRKENAWNNLIWIHQLRYDLFTLFKDKFSFVI